MERDRALALACMQAYNDWIIEDWQGVNPNRLIGLPMIPTDDGLEAALGELERVVAKGARGAFIPGMPRRPYNDSHYEPLWKAASDLDVPVTFHRTFGGPPPDQDWDELVQQNVSAAGTVNRFFSGVRTLTYMIFNGVFERHTKLQIVAAEVNCGWVPFWAQTMDQQYVNQSAMEDFPINRRPSEFLGRNVFTTVLDDEIGFEMMAHIYPRLVDTCMFSSDYPHSVTLWPKTREYAERLTKGLPEDAKEKVLSGNAARVYKV
jgi:predicted TIM-barrel fold metal-dependent hydrolase